MQIIFFGYSFSTSGAISKLLNLPYHARFAKDMKARRNNRLLYVIQTDETILYIFSVYLVYDFFQIAFGNSIVLLRNLYPDLLLSLNNRLIIVLIFPIIIFGTLHLSLSDKL